jgi:hypothetical protein
MDCVKCWQYLSDLYTLLLRWVAGVAPASTTLTFQSEGLAPAPAACGTLASAGSNFLQHFYFVTYSRACSCGVGSGAQCHCQLAGLFAGASFALGHVPLLTMYSVKLLVA